MYHTKATDAEILEAYEKTGSVWKAGEELGMSGQSIHERLKKMGKSKPVNVFTEEEKDRLRREYVAYRDRGRLQELADSMGRTKQFICRQAKKLCLTDKNHKAPWADVWKSMPDEEYGKILKELLAFDGSITQFVKEKGYGVQFELTAAERFPAEWEAITELKMSGAKMYRKGRDFEYAVKKNLEKHGYLVMRSPASKTPADLWAIKDGEALFVQCKLKGAFPVDEWNEFMDYAEEAGVKPILANRPKSGRGFEYWLLTDKKDGSKKPQPKTPYVV